MTEQKRLTLVEALESVLNETELATLRESEARLVELGHQIERYQKSPLKYLVENKGESGDDVRVALRPRKEAYDRLAQKLANGVCRATGYRILAQEIQSKTAETISVSAWKEGNLLDPSNGSVLTFYRNSIRSEAIKFDGVMIIPVYADWIESPHRLPLSQVWHWSQVLSFKVFNLLDPIEAGYWDIPLDITVGNYFNSKTAVKRAARDLVEAVCSGELLRLNPCDTSPTNGQINPQTFTYDTISDCVNYLEKKYFGLGLIGTYNKPAIEYFENIRFRRDDVLRLWQTDSSLEQPEKPVHATPAQAAIQSPPVDTETTVHVAKDEKPVEAQEVAPLATGPIPPKAKQDVDWAKAIVKVEPDIIDARIFEKIHSKRGPNVSLETIKRRMIEAKKRYGYDWRK